MSKVGMAKGSNLFRALIAHVVLSLLLGNILGCNEQPVQEKLSKPPVKVNVFRLTQVENTVKTATYYGVLMANRSRTPGFTVPGKINSIVKRGQKVAVNQTLAELDTGEIEKQKELLSSQLAEAQTQDQLRQGQEEISELEKQIQARRLAAPFDCVVDDVFAFENSLVRAQSPILRILESGKPRIKVNLPRNVVNQIQPDLDVYFLIGDNLVIGRLFEESQVENAGSILCRFNITSDLSNINYKFGQSVEARLSFQTGNSGFWVPLSALVRSGEGIWSLLVVETESEKNIVSRKLVTIVQLADDQALVSGDIPEGALAIADGIHRVVAGQKVEPRLVLAENESGEFEPADGEVAK